MDLVTPRVATPPGRVIASLNYEPVAAGYRRLRGYERYAGYPEAWNYPPVPSLTGYGYRTITVDVGAGAAPTVGWVFYGDDIPITSMASIIKVAHLGGASTQYILTVLPHDPSVVTSGSAVGQALTRYAGNGVSLALGTGASSWGTPATPPTAAEHKTAMMASIAGPGQNYLGNTATGIATLFWMAGSLYAVKTGTPDTIYKSGFTGWELVSPATVVPFNSGGTTVIVAGNDLTGAASGATGTVLAVDLVSGEWADGTVSGFLYFSSTTGSFQSGESINITAGAVDVATAAANESATALPNDGDYNCVEHNFFGTSDSSRLYFATGAGKAFQLFEAYNGQIITAPITTGMTVDAPTSVAAYKNHLFLAFPGGSIQFSSLGNPLEWTPITGAGAISIGEEVTGMIPVPNGLAIFGQNSIHILYGNDSADFTLETLTREAGALSNTVRRLNDVIYMDNRGIRSLSASRAYGNFQMGTLSRLVATLIEDKRRDLVTPVASCVVRSMDQYWVFFSDGTGLIMYMGGKDPSILPFNLGFTVSSAISVEDDTSERVFISKGADNNASSIKIFEMNVGTSFDGAAIEHYIRLPFNHFGKPQLQKVIKRVEIDIEASGTTTLTVSADYDLGAVPGSADVATSVTTGGAAIDNLGTNELYYASQIEAVAEAYLDGICRNVSLKIGGNTSGEEAHTLTGVTFHLLPRRQEA